MTLRSVRLMVAALAVGILTTSCVTTVDGSPRMAGGSGGIVGIGREIPQILPDRDDLAAVLGTPVDDNGFPPSVGDLDILPDGLRDSGDASEIQCLTVTFPYSKRVFENSPVRAVATQDWDNWGQGLSVPGFSVQAGALALASPADARALFTALTSQWQHCQGKTMILYKPGGSPADHLLEITNVRATDTMLSVIVMGTSPGTHTAPSPDERALGIALNRIVDVEVSDDSWRTGDPVPQNLAVKVAQAMLAKVSSTS